MSIITKTTIDVNNQSANMDYTNSYDTNTGKFDSKSTWSKIWDAAFSTAKMTTGLSSAPTQQLQAVSAGVAEGTVQSIDNIKDITKYLAVVGIIVVGLIIYSKLK